MVAIAILCLALPGVVQAQFSWTTNIGTITITGYPGPTGAVTIPAVITGLPVTSIGDRAFSNSFVTSVTIPNSITNIGNGAFYSCYLLTAITVQASNPAFSSVDGVLFNQVQTTLIQYPVGKAGGQYTIPNSVTNIGDRAFYYHPFGLTNIVIGNSVTSIGIEAFYYCGLISVTIPNSVTSIGDQAFYVCLSLASVTIPNSTTRIGSGAFAACANLSAIIVDALNPNYVSVDGVLFDKNQTALVQYPAGKAGSQYTIPNGVTTMGNGAFVGSRLVSATIPNSVTRIGDQAFASSERLGSVTIPNSVTTIGDGAFSGCWSLASVTIPHSVTSIGNSAFSGCDFLPNITIPSSVTSIGDKAFSHCWRLSAITVDALNPAYISVDGVLFNQNQTALLRYPAGKAGGQYTVPNSVTSIGDEAFSYWGAFYGGLSSVTIPNSVTSIGNGAFSSCWNLTNITIPNSVTSIGDGAFSGCWSLASVTIPHSVTSIREQAFYHCESLASVNIPNSVTTIGNGAFYGCWRLASVIIPDSVTDLGGAAFAGCALTNVTIGNGVSSLVPAWMDVDSGLRLAVGTFEHCASLTDITIPSSVTTLGDRAFAGCWSLASITIPSSVASIGDEVFVDCFGLTSVYSQGNAPSLGGSSGFINGVQATVFYLPGTAGWGATFGGRPTALWVLPNPLILNFGSDFGVQTNRFGFIISWATNLPVVVEASATLVNPTWTPVSTNTLNSGSSYFSDPAWTNHPSRFYRLRSP